MLFLLALALNLSPPFRMLPSTGPGAAIGSLLLRRERVLLARSVMPDRLVVAKNSSFYLYIQISWACSTPPASPGQEPSSSSCRWPKEES